MSKGFVSVSYTHLFSINQDDKVLHKVVLSDFSISKYKVTNNDYNKYLRITGVKKPPINICLLYTSRCV